MSVRHDVVTIEAIEKLICETEASIGLQKKVIMELRRDGRPAIGAATLLRLFESDLEGYRKVLDSICPRS
jgi:hypothetical protein